MSEAGANLTKQRIELSSLLAGIRKVKKSDDC